MDTPEVKSNIEQAGEMVKFSTPQLVSVEVPDTNSLLTKADAVAKRIEEANKKAEELVARHEAVAARMLLSGRAEAGAPMKTPEQSEQDKVDADVARTLKRFRG